jgi:hypothetical protein
MKVFNDKPGTRFRIRNGVTGGYVHITMMRVLEFKDRLEALAYIKRHDLNPMIYYVEVMTSENRHRLRQDTADVSR